jgi:hypothetical protein
MLIRFALWLFLLSLPFFLFVFTLKFAAFLLLSSFGLLIFAFIVELIKRLLESFKAYFSAPQREKRRFLFAQNQKDSGERLFHFKRLQLYYFKEFQRKKILEKNNRAHINALSKAIDSELKRVKTNIPMTLFIELRLENRRYRAQKKEQALLKLHKKISSLAGK